MRRVSCFSSYRVKSLPKELVFCRFYRAILESRVRTRKENEEVYSHALFEDSMKNKTQYNKKNIKISKRTDKGSS